MAMGGNLWLSIKINYDIACVYQICMHEEDISNLQNDDSHAAARIKLIMLQHEYSYSFSKSKILMLKLCCLVKASKS